MKRCPKCGTSNPDTNSRCSLCDNDISDIRSSSHQVPSSTYVYTPARRTALLTRCPKCGKSGLTGARCPVCDTSLYRSDSGAKSSAPITTNATHTSTGRGVDTWMYVISFLIPIVGIILGIVYVSQGRSDDAKGLFIAGILGIIIGAVLSGFVSSCYMSSLR